MKRLARQTRFVVMCGQSQMIEGEGNGVYRQDDRSRTSNGSMVRFGSHRPGCCRVRRRDVIDASKKLGRTSRLQRTTQRPHAPCGCIDFSSRVIRLIARQIGFQTRCHRAHYDRHDPSRFPFVTHTCRAPHADSSPSPLSFFA